MTEAVSTPMRRKIEDILSDIAEQEDVTILLAVESGSRAWGFHSPDSDYDVRFIYARPVDWFLTLGPTRDVIERPIDDLLDVSGWQLNKALGLALKGNAVLGEWLQSPIIYRSNPDAHARITDFCQKVTQPRPMMWHYLSLAEKHQKRAHLDDGRVRLKRLFYALRPALALRWMLVNDYRMPPMDMTRLCDGANLDAAEARAIAALIALKIARVETAVGDAPDPVILRLIDSALEQTRDALANVADAPPDAALEHEADRLHIALTKSLT